MNVKFTKLPGTSTKLCTYLYITMNEPMSNNEKMFYLRRGGMSAVRLKLKTLKV